MVVVGLDNDERFTEIMQIVQGTQRTCTKKKKESSRAQVQHKSAALVLCLCFTTLVCFTRCFTYGGWWQGHVDATESRHDGSEMMPRSLRVVIPVMYA